MIKGVNKQIVEINYTKNDYIEKAILIINPNKSGVSKDIIKEKADDYMATLIAKGSKNKDKQKIIGAIIATGVLIAIMLATIILISL